MNKTSQKIKLEAYILILVIAHLLGVILLRDYLTNSPLWLNQPTTGMLPVIGSKINLPDLEWSQQPKTLVLTLQKDCPSSNESADFYKRIIEIAEDRGVKLVAVFPTEKDESIVHLYGLGLTNMEVRQSSLGNLQVIKTPTLILTDDKGEITDYWIGKLTADRENEVISKLSF